MYVVLSLSVFTKIIAGSPENCRAVTYDFVAMMVAIDAISYSYC